MPGDESAVVMKTKSPLLRSFSPLGKTDLSEKLISRLQFVAGAGVIKKIKGATLEIRDTLHIESRS